MLLRVVALLLLAAGPRLASQDSQDWRLQMDGDTRPDVDSSADYVTEDAPQQLLPEIYSLHITSHIQLRYAITTVSSRIANPANISQEIFFNVVLPETAFISGFTMEQGGRTYEGRVEEKGEAEGRYEKALQGGMAAAHVTQSPRDSQRFTVSVNLQPASKANLSLQYEELLARRRFGYVHAVNIDPGQIVQDLSVGIQIVESTSITYVKVPPLRVTNQIEDAPLTDNDPQVRLEFTNDNSALVHWLATPQEQAALRGAGVRGQLVLMYDVERVSHQEQILASDGYFAHFFSPSDAGLLRKHVVFVLDCSRSMEGVKQDQVKDAMRTILRNLNKGDSFSLVLFASRAKVWSPRDPAVPLRRPSDYYRGGRKLTADMVVPATAQLVSKAVEYLYILEPHGSTNLNDALQKAFKLARLGRRTWKRRDGPLPESMLVLLTDGLPTRGRTDAANIAKLVTHRLNRRPRASLFALGFGEDVDMDFLRTLSLRNAGFARKIYEAADATLQLQDFYGQISSPLLANVTFHYLEDGVARRSLTETHFPHLFRGSELVLAGRLERPGAEVSGRVSFRGADGSGEVGMSGTEAADPLHGFKPGFMERLWAYLTVRQLLDRGAKRRHDLDRKRKALRLALKYSFVTPLTSMVVTKPHEVIRVEPLQIHFQGASEAGAGWPLVAPLGEAPGADDDQPGGLASWNQARDEGCSLEDLPWLAHVTDGSHVALPTGDNGTVEMLELGAGEQDVPFQECRTPESGRGYCRHLPHCVRRAIAPDLTRYLRHFCRIGSFAGVCCPDEDRS